MKKSIIALVMFSIILLIANKQYKIHQKRSTQLISIHERLNALEKNIDILKNDSEKTRNVVQKIVNQIDNPELTFSTIYDLDIWTEGSGPGSNPAYAKPYLDLLQIYFDDPKFHTIFDFGCGDWQLMSQIKIPDNKIYKGFDIVQSVIENDQAKYTKANIQFYHLNDLNQFKDQKGDLLIVKDVLMHLSNQDVEYFIQNILPNFKYALLTNGYHQGDQPNIDITPGQYRFINLQETPFNLTNLKEVLEYKTHSDYSVVKKTFLWTNSNYQ